MKALIPAGGAGTRLRPITHTSAKQLVPIANRPIIAYVLDDVAEAGITDIVVVIAPDTGAEVRRGVEETWTSNATFIVQDEPRGLAHTVLIAREMLGDEPFLMYLGDNMLRDGVTEFVRAFGGSGCAAQILVAQVPEPNRFGVVELDGDRVVRLVEKPTVPPSDLALVGVYMFDARVHDAVRALQPSARGELEITDAIQWLVDHGERVDVHRVTGWWKDTGRVEDLLEANRLVLEGVEPRNEGTVDGSSRIEGTVVVEPGARVDNSTLRGPLIIGEGTVVRDSFVGPFTSIGARCVIEDSEVEHSVIMEECRIVGAHRLEDSLLGRGVEVQRTEKRPKSYRLVVGDHGRVGIV